MQLTDDFASGFAMTIDSFCTAGSVGHNTIPYQEIKRAFRHNMYYSATGKALCVEWKSSRVYFYGNGDTNSYSGDPSTYNQGACHRLFKQADYLKVAKFLEVAKNF